ncbi:FKBP-type peptidyl-prolyl cis-trans isomerase N-terminal domain-containing protein [Solilutibacter silvestris]|uniref:peptidylprolyl isomerase n=1 Tax=Solilutibacter silvestris TaxID=1645665 RepID=A0A2K1PYN3_9GAMM|nr:FKBP-type peptidyl-prolyl cis-trans isomerase [Lysobacter silvestris]PNS07898.1 FKBP-type peptidyl-prolyl cis-trans isomerase [Lysobacter silvestris]
MPPVRLAALAVVFAIVAMPVTAHAAKGKAKAAKKPAATQQVQAPRKMDIHNERDRTSYMVGMEVGKSLADIGQDIDFPELEHAIRNALDGGKPLITQDEARMVSMSLGQRVQARQSGAAVPAFPPGVTPETVARLVGIEIGRSLAPARAEFDLPIAMQGIRAVALHQTPLLDEAQAKQAHDTLAARMRNKGAEEAVRNKREGDAFLARNRTASGVMTTRTGLQYQIIKDGGGVMRPSTDSTVRVSYEGRTLDGRVFDANKDVMFPLKAVIPGWTEGLQLMAVGSRYRFWIPSQLAYGAKGSPPSIPANSTLVFDVELLGLSR